MKRETREFHNVEFRTAGKTPMLQGYAAVFNDIAHGEMIAPGAFAKSLQEQADIKAYLGHSTLHILARTANGSLRLREDEKGLRFTLKPNAKTTVGSDVVEMARDGLLDGMSFGFAPVQESYREIDGERIRVLEEVRLFEVSVVTEPWYQSTELELSERDRNVLDLRRRRLSLFIDALSAGRAR